MGSRPDWLFPLDHVSYHFRAEHQTSGAIYETGIFAPGGINYRWRNLPRHYGIHL